MSLSILNWYKHQDNVISLQMHEFYYHSANNLEDLKTTGIILALSDTYYGASDPMKN